jgi:hypothetical protein
MIPSAARPPASIACLCEYQKTVEWEQLEASRLLCWLADGMMRHFLSLRVRAQFGDYSGQML